MVEGIDISHYQDGINFHGIVAEGKQFVYIKATEGTDIIDPQFQTFRQRAHEVGLLVGAYHFFNPTQDPVQQAEHFFNNAKPRPGELITMLDTETDDDNVAESSLQFALRVKQLFARVPWIYSSDSLYQTKLKNTFPADAWSVWIARYGLSPSTQNYKMWQYSQSGTIDGITVDLDRYIGTFEQFFAEFTVS